jgi:hypothetical protein
MSKGWLQRFKAKIIPCPVQGTAGRTSRLPRTVALPISPKAALMARAGTGSLAGLPRTRPRAWASSSLVTTPGATALTGPSNSGRSKTKPMIPITSSIEIQLNFWVPLPHLAPQPLLKDGQELGQRPTLGGEHRPEAQVGRPVSRPAGRVGRSFPGLADFRQKAGPPPRPPRSAAFDGIVPIVVDPGGR